MFRVFSYTPAEGPAGASIVVNVHFKLVSAETTFLRIVVGTRALSTTVRQAQDRRFGEWELEAVIPELETASPGTSAPSGTVPLTVQALNGTNETLDSVMFGNFTYSNRRIPPSPVLLNRADRAEDYGYGHGSAAPGTADVKPVPTRKSSRPTPGSGTARARALNAAMTSKEAQSARGQLKKQSLIRARRSGSEDDEGDSAYRAVLQIETALEGMADVREWDGEEKRVGRRLVRFSRVQEGCTLRVRCEALKPAEYTDGDTVVSCIYRSADGAGTGTTTTAGDDAVSRCCITSVDIIFLLECLVGDIFNIEEKNRIRRNLEGFRPKTVSKNKVGTEQFFQKIMDFPAPKPRNIEKDVKVFDWAVLPQALNKIISKYTLYPPSSTPHRDRDQDGDRSSSDPSTTPVSASPDPAHSSSAAPYSAHSSPRPAHSSPPPPPGDHSYFSFHPPAPTTRLRPLTPPLLHPRLRRPPPPHSATTTPSPLISTPADSPNIPSSGPMSMQYSPPSEHYNEPSHVLYPSPLIDHDPYGSVYSSIGGGTSYDTVDYHHNVKSELHDSSSYM
ncbi:hypothetical protein BD413DRAFT_493662 [Trametes elegans]|nr:hypothetical protein BD413DRAFT_493662 [Trametes elegans]